MDFLEWTDERSFRLSGRRDGAVQIGAVNVTPDGVARRLGEHPSIKNCRVSVGMRGDGVRRLVAHIELKSDWRPNERTARDIDAWCRKALQQQERPQVYQFEKAVTPDEKTAQAR